MMFLRKFKRMKLYNNLFPVSQNYKKLHLYLETSQKNLFLEHKEKMIRIMF